MTCYFKKIWSVLEVSEQKRMICGCWTFRRSILCDMKVISQTPRSLRVAFCFQTNTLSFEDVIKKLDQIYL